MSYVSKWHVLYTLPNYERKVNLCLLKHDIPTFLPLKKVERRWSDRRKTVEVPLFPNYIFIKTSEADRFKVLDTIGVICFISFGGSPALLDDKEIKDIKKLLESPSLEVEKCLEMGDVVKISDGPFKDMIGVLYGQKGKTRFGVKIESINQVLSIEICSSYIEPYEI